VCIINLRSNFNKFEALALYTFLTSGHARKSFVPCGRDSTGSHRLSRSHRAAAAALDPPNTCNQRNVGRPLHFDLNSPEQEYNQRSPNQTVSPGFFWGHIDRVLSLLVAPGVLLLMFLSFISLRKNPLSYPLDLGVVCPHLCRCSLNSLGNRVHRQIIFQLIQLRVSRDIVYRQIP